MNRQFDVLAATVAADAYAYVGNQQARASACRAERILYWPRDGHLPAYVTRAIDAAGFRTTQIGRTTFTSTTWALVRK